MIENQSSDKFLKEERYLYAEYSKRELAQEVVLLRQQKKALQKENASLIEQYQHVYKLWRNARISIGRWKSQVLQEREV